MKQTIIVSIALALITGCGPARIALEGEAWEKHEQHAVKGRQGLLINQKMQFGDFRTTEVRRSWTKGSDGYSGIGLGRYGSPDYLNIIGTRYIDRKQTLRFEMTDGQQRASSVYCVSHFMARDLLVGNDQGWLSFGIDLLEMRKQPDANLFYAQLYVDESGLPWQLMLENDEVQRQPTYYTGWVGKSREEYYLLVPVTKIQNNRGEALQMPFGAMGLELRDRYGNPRAAVNLADKGTVYFTADLPAREKFLLANICAALLLQEQIGS